MLTNFYNADTIIKNNLHKEECSCLIQLYSEYKKKLRKEIVTFLISNRKMPVDERLMNKKCEYLLELRTEKTHQVGYDGKRTVIKCKGIAIAVLCKVGNVSYL